ncbi:SDR family NAD(P)-dependent oxidoreductase [Amycolatopsis sp. QT-25]|uniref:SDR family NAD(P)-dependent oxidoreductase n=1 Tax=Amycolatopsis sp. QT-25 TaxID=3034022 RepID=UPI0023EAF8F4|nr:SDR family oxidoreductase [Amycolatopsis sp. QT-25]WET82977.1 SDR family NAD(P)-dependent oxidoreductase [Amycolatopsis sp. QT-25]
MRTAVVTGAGTGIGRAVAVALHAAGLHVIVTGRRLDPLEELVADLGGRAVAVPFDASDPAAVEAALEKLPEHVHVLVNNAGGNTDFDRNAPTGLAAVASAWRANLDANLLSAVLVTTALRDRLRPGGTVVHIGSIAADKGAGAYGAAKAGLASWTVDLAQQLGPDDVTVNTVAPGYVMDTEFFRDRLTDERRAALIKAAATRRPSTPDDIAATVAFLASPGARQITGQCVAVNGGERTTR